jgi:hypothetical protein
MSSEAKQRKLKPLELVITIVVVVEVAYWVVEF